MSPALEAGSWRRCSACKKPIALGALYYVCSVSTCNRKRTALHFCTVDCWEVHLPIAKHREAWAEDRTAPKTPEPGASRARPQSQSQPRHQSPPQSQAGGVAPRQPKRTLHRGEPSQQQSRDRLPVEVLIIASRLKDYVRARAGMNTSDRVLERFSEIVRRAADAAIENARRDERRTILERDIHLK